MTQYTQKTINELLQSILGQDLNKVKKILQQFPELINYKSISGRTLLESAIAYGHIDIIKYLLNENPDLINRNDNNGSIPLQIAIQRMDEHTQILKYITEFFLLETLKDSVKN